VAVVALGVSQGEAAVGGPRLPLGGRRGEQRVREPPDQVLSRLGYERVPGRGRSLRLGAKDDDAEDCGCGCAEGSIARALGQEREMPLTQHPLRPLHGRLLGRRQAADDSRWVVPSANSLTVALGAAGPDHVEFGRTNPAAGILSKIGAVQGPGSAVSATLTSALLGTASGGFGATPVFYSGAVGCWWLVAEDHWCHEEDQPGADITLEDTDVDLLNDAWWKLYRYTRYIADYFNYHADAWDWDRLGCVLGRVFGDTGELPGPMWVAEGEVPGLAETVLDTGFMTMHTDVLAAVVDIRDYSGDDVSYGDWHCPTSEVAGVVLHEIVHACGAIDGLLPQHLAAYWRYRYRRDNELADQYCCQTDAFEFPSWDQAETTCDDILAFSRYIHTEGRTRSGSGCGLTSACA
jgi:hypothetical protein